MKKYLKFEANWCHQCKQMDKNLKGCDFPVEHINVDDETNEELVEKFKIRSLPTLVLVEDDKVINRFNGLTPINELKMAYEA